VLDAVLAVCAACLVLLAPSTSGGEAAIPSSRYFELQITAGGGVHAIVDCDASSTYCSSQSSFLGGHNITWHWTAYALVVSTKQGLHLIGPRPRVAAYFSDSTAWDGPDAPENCRTEYSTGGGEGAGARGTPFLASSLQLAQAGPKRLNLSAGPPFTSRFVSCGRLSLSTYGRDSTPSSWRGVQGPWRFTGLTLAAPKRLAGTKMLVYLAYNSHSAGPLKIPWPHTSTVAATVVLTLSEFRGGRDNVLREEKKFEREHPAKSRGFTLAHR
jgi:hypothetical protein